VTATYEELRRRQVADMLGRLPEHVSRLSWQQEQVSGERRRALRALLRHAGHSSTWHQGRLVGVDSEKATEDDLVRIPPMTKDDVMGHFDDIVTDHRLSLALAESHLEGLVTDAYLLERYHVIASGGSSGRRGVFVYDWDGWITFHLGLARWSEQPAAITAVLTAGKASHVSVARTTTFATAGVHHIPVTCALTDIVGALNRLQPTALYGYPSALAALVGEAAAGRLQVSPLRVGCTGEPLFPETRGLLERTWGVPVRNTWFASEGGALATTCAAGRLHLNDDLVIAEPVDEEGRPVARGQPANRLLLTNLFNLVLPLIRYELTDQITLATVSCECGSRFPVVTEVHGRLDDVFLYAGGVRIHPLTFRSVLGRHPQIVEYQVRQLPDGAAVGVCAAGPIDTEWLEAELASGLHGAGVDGARVTVAVVDRLEQGPTGKIKRFVPLRS
jgi:phenylacetate-coenzyme A ligase PaaK-like adenylate-forming protein